MSKKIHNPVTKKWYTLRKQKRKTNTIKGLWEVQRDRRGKSFFNIIIKLSVNDKGEPGSLICFEHGRKKWCAYYIEPWESMEAELKEAGFPDNIIEFIYRFLVKYDRIDLPDDREEELEEDWIL